jgi:para-nitrobenzyl esterase
MAFRSIALLAVSACALACASEPPLPPPALDTSSARSLPAGNLVGSTGVYGSHQWLGIPFAAAPTADLRWRAPQPARRWDGTREALTFGSPCAQLASPFAGVVDREPGTFAGAEDCLYLNVYAPKLGPDALPAPQERLPVMVWIHGGGNSIGHASFYDGGRLAQLQGVVVVTINYRLGPFGWFRHASLRSGDDPEDDSGNFGILDQIQALRWVRDNIGAFGGDAGNVTIFGESAGGRDVMALLLSPPARGLFHRAISQSGNANDLRTDEAEAWLDAEPAGRPNSSNEILARLFVATGRASDREAAKAQITSLDATAIAAFLRETGPEALIRAYATNEEESIIDVPNVFGDGHVVRAGSVLEAFASGDYNTVPVMFGTNRDENKIFMFASPRYVRSWFGVLPRVKDAERFEASAALRATAWKLVGADEPARAIRRGGRSDVYVYRWDWDEEPSLLGTSLSQLIGASHGFEIPFVFGHYDLGPQGNIVWTDENRAAREQLSGEMMSYWTEFARSGNPGSGRDGDLTEWKAWDLAGDKFIVLDTVADGGLRMSADEVTAASVVAAATAETRLGEGRCNTLQDVERTLGGIGTRLPAVVDCATAAVASAP